MGANARANLRGLYAITPDDFMLPRLLAKVKAAVEGGARVVQYRNKSVSAELRKIHARTLLSVCRVAGACMIVNDDVALALEIGADGVHVGKDDCPANALRNVRQVLGTERILGVSCYNDKAAAQAASDAGADYLAVGSVFASTTKPQATNASLEFLADVRQRYSLPVCAIGGITLDNAPAAIDAGADMLAVISGLFEVMDIRQQAQQFQSLFSH